MQDLENIVEKLLSKAAFAYKSEDALRFSQAALNAANTRPTLTKWGQPQN